MYLAMFDEKQKQLFLGLAYHLASIDGDYSEEEKGMMESYCHEMKINFDLEKLNKSIENIVEEIKVEFGEREKKIVIFEATGLAMADNNYDKTEREFIHSIMIDFGIEETFDQKCETVINEYIEFQNKLNRMIIG